MKLLQCIIVPVDFGPRTDSAVDTAASLAKAFDSEVHLLHVVPNLDDESSEAREVLNMASQAASSRLVEISSRLESEGMTAVSAVVKEGCPFEQIIEHADGVDANVIVIGARRDDAEASRLGTTAERLCRRSNKPVWIVQPNSQLAPRSILCPVDGSPPSRRALNNAVHLARRFDAELIVLHVVRPYSLLPGLIPSVQKGMEQKHLKTETERFERFVGEFDFHKVRWQKMVCEGIPADMIVQKAAQHSVDLIVMGSVGRSGLSRILLGTVAGKVAGNLPCSMVMVKAEDAIRLKVDEELSDLETHYLHGCQLLEHGFLDEARRQFTQCFRISATFAAAWEGLADVYERQGNVSRAEECRQTARRIEETLEWRRVEADIRRGHPLWNKKN